MPQGFEPADRETVQEKAESSPEVSDTAHTGPGIAVIQKSDADGPTVYTSLLEECGWYLAAYKPDKGGDIELLMPITEVPTDE